jgi:hypothetical protein
MEMLVSFGDENRMPFPPHELVGPNNAHQEGRGSPHLHRDIMEMWQAVVVC